MPLHTAAASLAGAARNAFVPAERALQEGGTCVVEGDDDCEGLAESECPPDACVWEADIGCCADRHGFGGFGGLLGEVEAFAALQCLMGVAVLLGLNLVLCALLIDRERSVRRSHYLLATGARTPGTVMATQKKEHRGEHSVRHTYFVSFAFELPDGRTVACRDQEIAGARDEDERFYASLAAQGPVEVLYDGADPTTCAVKEVCEMSVALPTGCLKCILRSIIATSVVEAALMGYFLSENIIVAAAAVVLVIVGSLPGVCCKEFVVQKFNVFQCVRPGGGESVTISD